VALGEVPGWWHESESPDGEHGQGAYPMDYYAQDGGAWNSSYHKKPARRAKPAG
jgi:2-(3-amino-3-carboxypropyl)histidine synthase